jgi:hypothetical protein
MSCTVVENGGFISSNFASKEVSLEINIEKIKFMLLSRHQDVGQNWYTKIANRSFENVSQFKYFGMILRNQYMIQEEIKRRLNLAAIRSRPFCLWFCMGVKLGL